MGCKEEGGVRVAGVLTELRGGRAPGETLRYEDALENEVLAGIDEVLAKDARCRGSYEPTVWAHESDPIYDKLLCGHGGSNRVPPSGKVAYDPWVISIVGDAEEKRFIEIVVHTRVTPVMAYLFRTPEENIVKDAMCVYDNFELRSNPVPDYEECMFGSELKKRYSISAALVLASTDACESRVLGPTQIALEYAVQARYVRPDGRCVAVCAGVTIDTSLRKSEPTWASLSMPWSRIEHHVLHLTTRLASAIETGDLEYSRSLRQLAEILDGSLGAAKDGRVQDEVSGSVPIGDLLRHHEVPSIHVEVASDLARNAPRDGLQDPCALEVAFRAPPRETRAGNDDRDRDGDDGDGAEEEEEEEEEKPNQTRSRRRNTPIAHAVIYTHFFLPILDMAAQCGQGRAVVRFGVDVVTVRLVLDEPVALVREGFPNVRVSCSMTPSVVLRAVKHTLKHLGLQVQWSLCSIGGRKRTLQVSLGVRTALARSRVRVHSADKENDALSNVRDLSTKALGESADHAAASVHSRVSHLREQKKTNRVLPSAENAVATEPEYGPVARDHVMIVDDQASLCQMVVRCAKKHFDLTDDAIHVVSSPEDVATAHFAVNRVLEDPKVRRLVVIFDENIYTAAPTLERITYTGTQLRKDLLRVPALRRALQHTGRLVFVGYSTSPVVDPTLHFFFRKGTHTPRRLLAELFPSNL